MSFRRVLPPRSWVVVASVLLGACAVVPGRGSPDRYEQSFDSATSACRQNPALCAQVAGEEAVIPQGAQQLAETGIAVAVVVMALDEAQKTLIEQALKECAEYARSEVLIRELNGVLPKAEDCNKLMPGRGVTLAMFLGEEMHTLALQCTGERLSQLLPGGFSLEPRYRYDKKTRQTTFISEEEAQALLRQWRGEELKGTLRPDVVIHSGHPLRVQKVYDFKFPCASDADPPPWRSYPEGHPHEGSSQKAMYEEALITSAWRVVPRWGIMP